MSFYATVFFLFSNALSLLYHETPRPILPIATSQQIACKAIIFDMGGVIVDTCKKKTFWQIGPKMFFEYWRHAKNPRALPKRLYDMLDAAHPTHKKGNLWGVKDGNGRELPQLVAEWLRGMKPNREIFDQVTSFANENPTWFSHPSEQRTLIRVAHTIFNPHSFIKTRKFFDASIELIHECKARGFKLYILSNWDRESAQIMQEKKPELFALFDDIIFSGDVQLTKPEPAIFKNITDIIPAEECIFIDDQVENIEIAQELGFNTILVENKTGTPNINAVREQLKNIKHSIPQEAIYA